LFSLGDKRHLLGPGNWGDFQAEEVTCAGGEKRKRKKEKGAVGLGRGVGNYFVQGGGAFRPEFQKTRKKRSVHGSKKGVWWRKKGVGTQEKGLKRSFLSGWRKNPNHEKQHNKGAGTKFKLIFGRKGSVGWCLAGVRNNNGKDSFGLGEGNSSLPKK